jgi:hypothetical protein
MHYDGRGHFLEERAMALKATKAEVWAATIEDRAGGAADKLEALARGGASLEMLLARRTEQPGQGFGKPGHIHSVRVEGSDKPGLGSKIARALGNAGINFRGVSAVAIGSKFISYIACDSAEDADKAVSVLKKL